VIRFLGERSGEERKEEEKRRDYQLLQIVFS